MSLFGLTLQHWFIPSCIILPGQCILGKSCGVYIFTDDGKVHKERWVFIYLFIFYFVCNIHCM